MLEDYYCQTASKSILIGMFRSGQAKSYFNVIRIKRGGFTSVLMFVTAKASKTVMR